MKRFIGNALSINFWVGCFSVLALIGLALCAVGYLSSNRQLIVIGAWLNVPLMVGGVLLLVVVIPALFFANRRNGG